MVQSTDGNPPRVELRVEEVLRGEDRGPTEGWPPLAVAAAVAAAAGRAPQVLGISRVTWPILRPGRASALP